MDTAAGGGLDGAGGDPWPVYDAWNAAIADEFFTGRHAGKPVYLDLEADSIGRIASALGIATEGVEDSLTQAVRPTLRLGDRGALFGLHRPRLVDWLAGDHEEAPPVVGVLAFLSLVAERMQTDGDFRASNYYGRFARMVGVDAKNNSMRQKIMRGFSHESHLLWSALNNWLEANPEVRGYPTAFAFDYRVHVGRPMSQALVRERDREALHEMFSELRLAPREEIARSDMARLLGDWLGSASISGHLKTLCSSSDEVLERVAGVACVELQAWDGGLPEGSESRQGGRAAIVANLRRLPRPSLELGALVRLPGDEALRLKIGASSSEGTAVALGAKDGEIEVGPADDEAWREISGAELRIPELLVSRIQLEGDGVVVTRAPRRLVLLERDDTRLRFSEVERARLGADYMLLATESLAPRLDPALEECAREGYEKLEAGVLPGLPPGWLLYKGIELIAITTAKHADLASLVPVAWTQIAFGGGLRLPGRQAWHSALAPELRASAAVPSEVGVRVTGDGEGAEAAIDEGELDLGAFSGAGVFALDECDLPDGDYRVALLEGDTDAKTLTASRLRLRSADWEGPAERAVMLANDASGGPMFAMSASEGGGFSGALIAEPEKPSDSSGSAPPSALDEYGDEVAEHADADEFGERSMPEAATEAVVVSLPDCMESGAHHFDLDRETSARPAAWGEIGGVCLHCGMEKFWPERPWKSKSRGGGGRADRLATAAERPQVPPIQGPPDPNMDALLDALSYLGGGGWESFSALVGQLDDAPWAALEAARMLSALGHIEVTRDPKDLRRIAWSITPSTLVIAGGDSFLAGWRSQRMLSALSESAEEQGLRWVAEAQEGAPTRIGLGAVSVEQAAAIVESAGAGVRRPIEAVEDPADRLAQVLPGIDELRAALPALEWPPDQDLERFDLESGEWLPHSGRMVAGGYRTRRLPRRFWHFDGSDWRPADSRIVKWFAAIGERSMLAWGSETRSLAVHLGCEPPGLYERAAVLCSGRMPHGAGGQVVYENVDESVAAMLAARLVIA